MERLLHLNAKTRRPQRARRLSLLVWLNPGYVHPIMVFARVAKVQR